MKEPGKSHTMAVEAIPGCTLDSATGEAELPLKIGDVFESLSGFNAAVATGIRHPCLKDKVYDMMV